MPNTNSLEDLFGYHFQDPGLLSKAMIHGSARDTKGIGQDEIVYAQRLSWLGDSVLDLIISHELYSRFPKLSKEDLNDYHIQLTNNDALGRLAQELGLRPAMVIGKSLQQDRKGPDHVMLAGALEAVLGAIYLDGGIQSAQKAVRRILSANFRKLPARPSI